MAHETLSVQLVSVWMILVEPSQVTGVRERCSVHCMSFVDPARPPLQPRSGGELPHQSQKNDGSQATQERHVGGLDVIEDRLCLRLRSNAAPKVHRRLGPRTR